MTHKEFVEVYKSGTVRVEINESDALKLMNTSLVDRPYQYATIFWSWIWILCIPIGVVLIIWVNMWLGIAVVVIGLLLPRAIKKSSSENVLEQALRNEEFYNALVEAEIMKVERIQ
jgi:hypothetical protein